MNEINFRCLSNPLLRANAEGRTATFVASDGTRDSYNTVLTPDNWKLDRFNRNGVIGYQHKVYGSFYDNSDNPDNIIGKGRAYIEETKGVKRLLVDVEFEPEGMNALADKIWAKLQFGTLKAVSVGFHPVGRGSFGKGDEGPGEKNETYYYAGQELLEVSIVNIPANPNALKRSEGEGDELSELRAEALRKQETPVEAPEETVEPAEQTVDSDALRLELDRVTSIARAALLSNN